MSPKLADAAALVEPILETVVHSVVAQYPVSIGGQRLISECRRLISAYLEGSCTPRQSPNVGIVFVDQTAERL